MSEKAYLLSDEEYNEIWQKGYDLGFHAMDMGLIDSLNPYHRDIDVERWEAFEMGYEEGWLDS